MLPRLATTSSRRTCCYSTSLRWSSSRSQAAPTAPADSKTSSTASDDLARTTAPAKAEDIKVKPKTRAELDAEAIARFEERFGGSAETQLGTLDENGRPTGMGKESRRNLFRLI